MIRLGPEKIDNLQEITAVVAGPDRANRLTTLDGQLEVGLAAVTGVVKETLSVLLGPVLTRRQFVRAAATASPTTFNVEILLGTGTSFAWSVVAVDADWDDESGQVELRIECSVSSGPNTRVSLHKLGFHVTLLAEM